MARRRLSPEARQRALIDAGLQLFGSRPYADVTIGDICQKAGVSRPLLQHYFGNKQEFFVAVIKEAMVELERTTRPPVGADAFAALEDNLKSFFFFMLQHPVGATIARSDEGGVGAAAKRMFDAYRDRTFNLIAQALGNPTPPPKIAAAIRCWIALNETLTGQILARPGLSADWAASFSGRMLFHMLGEAEK
jgi:AcrR family transcriptional regulator